MESVVAGNTHKEVANVCYHCGDACPSQSIQTDGKQFCCEGCKTVYEILAQGDLCNYYQLETSPGTRKNQLSEEGKYAWLDHDGIVSEIVQFRDSGIARVSFTVPNIHCSSCIWLLENLHRLDPGVIRSQVNFIRKEATVTYREADTSLRQVVELMDAIGYEPLISLKGQSNSKTSINKDLAIRIGVAGFCFGNIMLMSFPEYLGDDAFHTSEFRRFFGYANFLLSLPVMFYSGTGYLKSAWKVLKHRNLNLDVPIAMGMFALFFRSAYDIFITGGAGYMDSLAGLIFFLLIGKWHQDRIYRHLSYERDYRSYFPMACTKVIPGSTETIALNEVEPGNTLLIRNQELIPADAVLLKGEARIDYSFVTGEADPVRKAIGELLYAGGRQHGASIEVEVRSRPDQSYLTKLWNQDTFLKGEQTGVSRLSDLLGKRFTLVITLIAMGGLIYWLLVEPAQAFHVFTSVLIIACPCALALSIPFTFGNTLKWFGKTGMYCKSHTVVEDLASVSDVVFDKTGTITQSKTVKVEYHGEELSQEEKQAIGSLASHSLHPLSQVISGNILENTPVLAVGNFRETTGKGIEGEVPGMRIRLGSETFVCGNGNTDAVRSIRSFVSINGVLKGHFSISKGYREDLGAVVADLKKQHTLHLLSGDNDAEKQILNQWFEEDKMRFRQSPQDKLEYIQQLQTSGAGVMMIGDGLNDAGALHQSDVGVAVADNVYAFSPACDAILDSRSFGSLHLYRKFATMSLSTVKQSFALSFLYNSVGLAFALSGNLSPLVAAILMPLSSVTVVAFTTLKTNWIAKKLKISELTKS